MHAPWNFWDFILYAVVWIVAHIIYVAPTHTQIGLLSIFVSSASIGMELVYVVFLTNFSLVIPLSFIAMIAILEPIRLIWAIWRFWSKTAAGVPAVGTGG